MITLSGSKAETGAPTSVSVGSSRRVSSSAQPARSGRCGVVSESRALLADSRRDAGPPRPIHGCPGRSRQCWRSFVRPIGCRTRSVSPGSGDVVDIRHYSIEVKPSDDRRQCRTLSTVRADEKQYSAGETNADQRSFLESVNANGSSAAPPWTRRPRNPNPAGPTRRSRSPGAGPPPRTGHSAAQARARRGRLGTIGNNAERRHPHRAAGVTRREPVRSAPVSYGRSSCGRPGRGRRPPGIPGRTSGPPDPSAPDARGRRPSGRRDR